MNMAGLRMKAVTDQLRILLTHSARQNRHCVRAYSAAQQKSTGDKSTGDDGTTNEDSYTVILERKAAKLEEEVQDLKIRYQQAVIDSQNIKERTKKFVADAKLFGIQSFCRDLVEVADIVEKAVENADKDELKDMSYETLCKIEKKLQSIFTKHGLYKMQPVGGHHDPYEHEIVCHVPAAGRKAGSIATVLLDGYKLHGRTIRHAHVGLAVETQH